MDLLNNTENLDKNDIQLAITVLEKSKMYWINISIQLLFSLVWKSFKKQKTLLQLSQVTPLPTYGLSNSIACFRYNLSNRSDCSCTTFIKMHWDHCGSSLEIIKTRPQTDDSSQRSTPAFGSILNDVCWTISSRLPPCVSKQLSSSMLHNSNVTSVGPGNSVTS